MSWQKLGLIFKPNLNYWWSRSHAMIPTLMSLGGGVYRVYYSGRNDINQSHIGWFELDLCNPGKILNTSCEPVLTPGRLGCFDDNGVTPSCIIRLKDGRLALYYIGWNPGSTVRMHLFGGLALSNDNGLTFSRYSEAPILERNITDPFLNTAPMVVEHNNEYRMFYVSGVEWKHKDLPRYNIKVATSKDGLNWNRKGLIAIDFEGTNENALARPYVIVENGIWKMWFSFKGKNYRIAYAESTDGFNWKRIDGNKNLSVSKTGFDSDMVEYSAVTKYAGQYFMFYNGNNYGFDGIGLAKLELD